MIVGTAGHIDHGKTSLVKALTGVDTDRLKEEKARGISIELGYAYLPSPGGGVIGFVDVPGHERFVDHMVAGATGVDFVVLVVAADDGPMPQTREHLDIIELLGIREGAIALTKVDRVDAYACAEAASAARALVASTPLAQAPLYPVSSLTGEGLAGLKNALFAAAARPREALRRGAGLRLAVDRRFTLDGVGTVVTGTVHAGQVRVGDEVVVSPGGISARVRSIHAQDRKAVTGQAGERCALVLAGVDREDVERGDWVVSSFLHAPTDRFDARLRIARAEPSAFQHWTPVHLHIGAAHVMAHVALLEGERLAPGESALAQVVTGRPIGACAGDAFVVRDASASRTLGGGRVLDPRGRERHRRAPEHLALLHALEDPDPATRLALALETAGTLDVERFRCAHNLPEAMAMPAGAVRLASPARLIAAAAWQEMRERFIATLSRHHGERADEMGPDLGRIRRMAFPRDDAAVVQAIAESLLDEGKAARSGPWWHLPGHTVQLDARERVLAQLILPRLEEEAYDPPWVRDLARELSAPESEIRTLMRRLGRRGDVFAVMKDLYYARSAVAKMAAIAQALEREEGAVRAAPFRDRTGIGRKRAIQVLEFFDRVGFTRRTRGEHRLRADSLLKLEQVA